jgi:hypothetical protein
MDRSRVALFIVVVALLAFAGTAAADVPSVVAPNETEFQPYLSGDSVLNATGSTGDDDIDDSISLWRYAPGSLPAIVAKFTVGNNEHHLSVAVTDKAFVAARGEIWDCSGGEGEAYDPCMQEVKFLYQSGSNPVRSIAGCLPDNAGSSEGEFGADYQQPVVAAEGSTIAIPVGKGEVCGKNSSIGLLDLENSQRNITIPGSAEFVVGVAMAGKYVGVLSQVKGPSLVVRIFDRDSRSIVAKHTFRTSDVDQFEDPYASFDIQSDGTVALDAELFAKKKFAGKRRAFCARKQSIVLMKLAAIPSCAPISPATQEVKLSDSKLLAYEKGIGEVSRLTAYDIASGARQVVRTTTDADAEPFDFDGRRIVWAEQGCVRNSIQVANLGPDLVTEQPSCPMEIPSPTITLTKHRKFNLNIVCPKGCDGLWTIAGPKPINSDSKLHQGEVEFDYGDFMSLNPSPNPQSNKLSFYYHVSDYLRKHPLKRIGLTWISYAASVDGVSHEKTFWFDVKYR